jgi:hypothetical protein
VIVWVSGFLNQVCKSMLLVEARHNRFEVVVQLWNIWVKMLLGYSWLPFVLLFVLF